MVDIHNPHKLQTNYINFCTFVGLKVICTGCNTSSKGLSKRWTVFLLTLRSPTTWPPNTRTNTRMSRMSCTHFRKSLTKAVYSCQGKVFLAFLYTGTIHKRHRNILGGRGFSNFNVTDELHALQEDFDESSLQLSR